MRFTPFATLASTGLLVDYLIVGGGAKGEASNQTDYAGYGGGAGGYLTGSLTLNFGTQYPIQVGVGGADLVPLEAQSSSFSGLGAGGGVGAVSGVPQLFGAANTIVCGGKTYKAGGGGASGAGTNPSCAGSDGIGGNGGNGLTWFDGNTYAGGGGGGTYGVIGYAGTGGTGGGGRGGYNNGAAVTGSANTGGGGGGGSQFDGIGANGGSGIVIIRYAGNRVLQGGTITTTGGYTYHTFTTGSTLFT